MTDPAAACHPRAPDAKIISTPWEKKKVSLDIELAVNSLKEFRLYVADFVADFFELGDQRDHIRGKM